MFPKPDPFFSFTPSPHADQSPMKKPAKSCPLFQLAGDFDSDTSNGTARIRFPRTQSPSSPQECRERSAQKSPEDPTARGASDFLTLNKDKRAFQDSFSTKEVIFYSSWSEERNVLGRTEWCSTSETRPNNPISE